MLRDGWGAGAVAVRRLPRGERGSVSAETAVVLPVLLVVLAMAVWVLAAVGAQLRCTDAAGVAARLVARGEPPEQVVAAARDIAPAGASVELRSGAATVEVRVRASVPGFGGVLSRLPALDVAGRAVSAREDRAGAAPVGAPVGPGAP